MMIKFKYLRKGEKFRYNGKVYSKNNNFMATTEPRAYECATFKEDVPVEFIADKDNDKWILHETCDKESPIIAIFDCRSRATSYARDAGIHNLCLEHVETYIVKGGN